jgi:putative methionine-R-sulfoxide reductase with GAF domain
MKNIHPSKRERGESSPLETLEKLYTRIQNLAGSLDQMAVANESLRTSVELLGASMAWLGRAEEDGSVTLLAQFPGDHPYPASIRVRSDDTPEGKGPTGRAVRSGIPQYTHEVRDDPAFCLWRPAAEKHGFRSTASIPLISRGRIFGALNLYSRQPGFFSSGHPEIMQIFAHQVASAMENARLFEENTRQLMQLVSLRRIDMAIAGSLDPHATYMAALDEITNQPDADAAAILRFDPAARTLKYAAGRGFFTRTMEGVRIPLGRGCVGRAALEQRVVHSSCFLRFHICERLLIFHTAITRDGMAPAIPGGCRASGFRWQPGFFGLWTYGMP